VGVGAGVRVGVGAGVRVGNGPGVALPGPPGWLGRGVGALVVIGRGVPAAGEVVATEAPPGPRVGRTAVDGAGGRLPWASVAGSDASGVPDVTPAPSDISGVDGRPVASRTALSRIGRAVDARTSTATPATAAIAPLRTRDHPRSSRAASADGPVSWPSDRGRAETNDPRGSRGMEMIGGGMPDSARRGAPALGGRPPRAAEEPAMAGTVPDEAVPGEAVPGEAAPAVPCLVSRPGWAASAGGCDRRRRHAETHSPAAMPTSAAARPASATAATLTRLSSSGTGPR
jgi:hypothetical protein